MASVKSEGRAVGSRDGSAIGEALVGCLRLGLQGGGSWCGPREDVWGCGVGH